MAKSIFRPEYIEIAVKEVLNSFAYISNHIHDEDNPHERELPEPDNNIEDKEKNSLFFRMWLTEQFKRYDKVYNAVERNFKEKGIILPPEPIDFMRWFTKFARKSQDYLTVKIRIFILSSTMRRGSRFCIKQRDGTLCIKNYRTMDTSGQHLRYSIM